MKINTEYSLKLKLFRINTETINEWDEWRTGMGEIKEGNKTQPKKRRKNRKYYRGKKKELSIRKIKITFQ